MEAVRELAKILSAHGLTRIEYLNGDMRVTLEKGSFPASEPQIAPIIEAAPRPQNEGTTVTSPLVGVAYRSREPGAPPLVEVGSVVKKGDAVCIIEAMKMFSDIPAPCDGTVLEILFHDGELREFGAPLLVIGEAGC